jgi:methionine-gamma-lyase
MSTPHHQPQGFATRAIHHGYDPADHHGALVPPIYQTSTFAFPSAEYGAACFSGEASGHFYTRISNPTLNLLEQRMAALEGGAGAVAFGSGMGAITAVCWTLLKPGDEIITDITLYGCTYAFFEHGLQRFGVTIRHIDLTDPAKLADAISERTRMVYFESPANPNMRLADIAALSKIAHAHGALVVVDSTYCTPWLQRPLELGADIVVHSATKYLNGHGDVTAGIAVCADAEIATSVRLVGLKDMTGAVLSPHDANLILRGLKTLALRMERHCANAAAIAHFLASRPEVEVVHFPGLPNSPQHALAKRQMRAFGGMLAFELRGGLDAGRRFLNALNLITRAVSLGDAETLVQHPASMTHSTYTPEERAAANIPEGLVRLSAGLEDIDDLLADIEGALLKSQLRAVA